MPEPFIYKPTGKGATRGASGATSGDVAMYGPRAEAVRVERELTDEEYDQLQRELNARAVIEREAASAAVAVPRGAPMARPRAAGASRATTALGRGDAAMEALRGMAAANRRRYYGD